jgi:ubiquinone/menaquinone biosynthesis C-methylase UbiE
MELFPELEKRYTEDKYSTREAQRMAEFIAFGPIVFQATRLMLKYGILALLRENNDNGLTQKEICEKLNLREYTVKCLMEASLCIGTVMVDTKTDRYRISKVGWFLLTDEAVKVNMDFVNDVNYMGFYYLDESFRNGRPEGLKTLGNWDTIYEGLSVLPEPARTSWFSFDHFYSSGAFDQALEVIFDRPVKRILDVGGNTGKWALRCVQRDKNVEVTILDLPPQIELMRKAVAGKEGAERIKGLGMNILHAEAKIPSGNEYDVIWMSQFLDCFSEDEILEILKKAAAVMGKDTRLCIMELLWNRQKYEPAAFCLTMTSLYFTAMANGNSKMYYSEDITKLIEKAGLRVEKIIDKIGQGHNILICRK